MKGFKRYGRIALFENREDLKRIHPTSNHGSKHQKKYTTLTKKVSFPSHPIIQKSMTPSSKGTPSPNSVPNHMEMSTCPIAPSRYPLLRRRK
ncbi:hypothetical protein EYC84_011972 [Monilinia fructicola]|uniref:Uncharacterized protein n=1 Tax=Monilinia fructicola TaxID=38448 RepID=A0A5M9J4V7_MONFR|nr:hypothetical protein EYC84_011972 [Monilinia fructicola]